MRKFAITPANHDVDTTSLLPRSGKSTELFGVGIRRLRAGKIAYKFKKLAEMDGIYEFSVNAPNYTYQLFAF